MSEQERIIPETVSPMAQQLLGVMPLFPAAETVEQWQQAREGFRQMNQEWSDQVLAKCIETTETKEIAGLPVTIITPKGYNSANDDKIGYYIHGGGYTLGAPPICTIPSGSCPQESVSDSTEWITGWPRNIPSPKV